MNNIIEQTTEVPDMIAKTVSRVLYCSRVAVVPRIGAIAMGTAKPKFCNAVINPYADQDCRRRRSKPP